MMGEQGSVSLREVSSIGWERGVLPQGAWGGEVMAAGAVSLVTTVMWRWVSGARCSCPPSTSLPVLLASRLLLRPFCTFPQVAWQSDGLARRGT